MNNRFFVGGIFFFFLGEERVGIYFLGKKKKHFLGLEILKGVRMLFLKVDAKKSAFLT
jgi:hypothetical protein